MSDTSRSLQTRGAERVEAFLMSFFLYIENGLVELFLVALLLLSSVLLLSYLL